MNAPRSEGMGTRRGGARSAGRGGAGEAEALRIAPRALARLMPMYLWLGRDGLIRGAGPTLVKILGGPALSGRDFFALFQVKRPRGITGMAELARHAGARMQLSLRDGARTGFRGLAVPVAAGGGMVVNLSFGISVGQGVRDHALTNADFAPTDLAMELLYLAEAKALVMGELRDLNQRLETARRHAEAEAVTDTLTGLSNRRGFEQVMAALLRRGTPFGLMHLDLDYFKQVNDSLGHAAGDQVLRSAAQRLTGEMRAVDTIARVGGDEFVLLLPGLVDPGTLGDIAGRIIARLSQPINAAGQRCAISASLGITHTGLCARASAARLLSDADAALYASKHAGRGRWTLWSPGLAPAASTGPENRGDRGGERH